MTVMAWPAVTDYNEAIQNPDQNCRDPDLRQGQPATNALGWPLPCCGNFAAVYKVTGPNQNTWAVKCFTREAAGRRDRYRAISDHLQQARLPFAVEFQFLDEGLRIQGRWYPVLKMRWVEGFTLNDFVKQQLDKPALLDRLGQMWVKLAQQLRQAEIAHADLQHGNVLLVPGRTANALAVKLIDYDGLFVPALAGTSSGEVGHANFQHPQRLQEGTCDLEVDRFGHLVIATALRCLVAGGRSLWERYDNGENLLFREQDFAQPAGSGLWRELWQLRDGSARALVGHLLLAAHGPLATVPFLPDLCPNGQAPTLTPEQAHQVEALLSDGKPQPGPVPAGPSPEAEGDEETDLVPILLTPPAPPAPPPDANEMIRMVPLEATPSPAAVAAAAILPTPPVQVAPHPALAAPTTVTRLPQHTVVEPPPETAEEPSARVFGMPQPIALIVGCVGGALFLIAFVAALVFMFRPDPPQPTPPPPVVAQQELEQKPAPPPPEKKKETPPPAAEPISRRLLRSAVWIVASDGKRTWTGSGSLIDRKERLVLTNEHVANPDCTSVVALFPAFRGDTLIEENPYYQELVQSQKAIPAQVVAADRKSDLALLQLARLPDDAVPLALAAASVCPGQALHCLGSNNQAQWILCSGSARLVSDQEWDAKDGPARQGRVIDSHLPTNPGDSGGPVIDGRCVLVGVHLLRERGAPNAKHIDVSEVRAFVRRYFRSENKEWTEPEETPPAPAPAAEVQKWLAALKHTDAGKREQAVAALADFGPAAREAVPVLLQRLRDRKEVEKVRKAAARALGEIGPPPKDALAALTDALADADCREARLYAADVLGRLGSGDRKVVLALGKGLKDADPDIRCHVAGVLSQVRGTLRDEVFPVMLAALRDKERAVRVAANLGLARLGQPSPGVVPALRALLEDRTGPREGRVYAAKALAHFGRTSLPALCAALQADGDVEILCLAAGALGTLKERTKEVGQALGQALAHPEKRVRQAAVAALVNLGCDGTTLPAILKGLKHADEECRQTCVGLLPRCSAFLKDAPADLGLGAELVDDLKTALASPEPAARAFAAFALGSLGEAGATALPELRKVWATEKEQAVKVEVLAALGEFGPKAAAVAADLKDLLDNLEAPTVAARNLKSLAALTLLKVRGRDAKKSAGPAQVKALRLETEAAYKALAQALLLANHLGPGPLEKELHQRAQEALVKGGKAAAREITTTFPGSFGRRPQDPPATAADRANARKTAFQVLARMRQQAKLTTTPNTDPVYLLILRTLREGQGFNPEAPTVLQSANEALLAIYSKR
jgi:hypothetical protein